jgi:hypothetical protein
MAINKWLGTATAVAQVDTCTPASVGIGDIFTLTTTGFDGTSNVINYTAVDTSATTVSGALITLWNNSTDTLQTGITASGTATVILTADTAGTAFKVASSASGGSATFVRVATTANGGPNDWQDANNWSEGTVPGAVASEDTVVENSDVDILYGLDNSGASNTLDNLTFKQTYTGLVGHNETAGYVGDYLQVKTTNLYIGENFDGSSSSGSKRMKIDLGTVAAAVIVYNTGTTQDTNKPTCRLLANNASTIIREIRSGSVGLSFLDSETSTVGSSLLSGGTLSIGIGTTLTTYNQEGGQGTLKCAATTVTSKDGSLLIVGEGAITTLNAKGGTVTPVSTGTITTCNNTGGTCDFTQSAVPRTVTTLKVGQPATLKIDTSVVTVTNNIEAFESGRFQYRVASV